MNRSSWNWTRLIRLSFALLTLSIFESAHAAGITSVTIPAAGGEPALQVVIWTPCARAAATIQMGALELQGVPECAVTGDALPLIIISHGKGGTSLSHHDTASVLANAGFVVASLNHPGDSLGDDSRADSLAIFESRTRDMSRLISFMTKDWNHRARLKGTAIGVFGFSRGGSTALNLIGANPNAAVSFRRFCAPWWSFVISMCRQLNADGAKIHPVADLRVRAAVVVDPVNLFDASSFKAVRVPIQLWASEQGGDGVKLSHVLAIKSQLTQQPEFHIAKGAGHFAYLAPCPPLLVQSAKQICTDPQGFDRTAWHKQMNADIVSFFQKNLH